MTLDNITAGLAAEKKAAAWRRRTSRESTAHVTSKLGPTAASGLVLVATTLLLEELLQHRDAVSGVLDDFQSRQPLQTSIYPHEARERTTTHHH